MTDTDKVIQIAASRIQGLTRQVNHWKDRTEELEAALGIALGIKSGDNIIKAIDKLKQERDCAKDEWDREEERCKGLASDIEVLRVELRESQKEAVTARQDAVMRAEADRMRFVKLFNDRQRLQAELAVIKDEHNELRGKLEASEAESRVYFEKSKELAVAIQQLEAPRQHPVKVGEWVKRTSFDYCPNTKMGAVAKVVAFDDDGCYRVTINGAVVCWSPIFCTPCDPPETTQDTPEDKETTAGAVTPKPGDKVRLVRVPTEQDCEEYDYTDPEQRRLMERRLHTTGTVLAGKHECGCLQVQMAHSAFVKAWPQSCIEIVDGK